MTDINKLQSKENSLFKSALNFYTLKQYKKGLKTTEQILKKNPEHGGIYLYINSNWIYTY